MAGPYTVVERPGTIPVSAWVLSRRDHADFWLQGASSMLAALSDEFGPGPFREMAFVEVPRPVAKAAGFNAFSPARFLVLNSNAFNAPDVKYMYEWLGHEMTHQWFPHAVIWDPPGFLYLEEALAEYGGWRLVERLAGRDAARRLRMTGFEFDPIYSAAAYFRLVGAGVDEPLAGLTSGIHQRNLAYNKGAFVFHMLAREIGQTRFQQIMHGVVGGRRGATISWDQFRAALEAGAGRDLDWFFEQWLTRSGAPDFQMSWEQDGRSVRGTVTQAAPGYRVRLKIEARGGDGQRAEGMVEVGGLATPFRIAADFQVVDVVLDPDYEVLRWTPEFRAMADSIQAAGRRP
jgi:aminopeptidase N